MAAKAPPEFIKILAGDLKQDYEVLKVTTPYKIGEIDPDIIIIGRNCKKILKYCRPDTYVIFLSSKHVFKPTEYGVEFTDVPNNECEDLQEELIVKKRENYLIVRIDSFYNKARLDYMKDELEHEENPTYDNSTYQYPLFPQQAAVILKSLIDLEAQDIIHMRGIERTTEYNIAKIIASYFKLPFQNVKSIKPKTKGNVKLLGIVLPGSVRSILKKYYG